MLASVEPAPSITRQRFVRFLSRLTLAALACIALACGPEPDSTPITIDLLTDSQPAQGCMDALATGRLVPDMRSGLGLAAPNGERTSVMWPFGYSAVYADDVIQLVDADGMVIAVEGDVVQMGGGNGLGGLFYACAGSVERV